MYYFCLFFLCIGESFIYKNIKYNVTGLKTASVVGPAPDVILASVDIPSTVEHEGQKYTVTTIGAAAFRWNASINSIKLPQTLQEIGIAAFSGCTGFTGPLIIPSSVTKINSSAFSGCTELSGELVIPSSLTLIDEYVFSDCKRLTSLIISRGITSIGNCAFSECSGFTGKLVIPNSVTSIGIGAFEKCSGFTGTLFFPNSVTSIGNSAFEGCSKFSGDLVIPDSITSIGMKAFEKCTGFSGSLKIGNGLTSISGKLFYECTGFSGSLTIGTRVTSIDPLAFENCKFRGKLSIPDSVTFIGIEAFAGCSKFSGTLKLPKNLTSIGRYAFRGCNGFTGSLKIPDTVTSIGESAFKGLTQLTGSLMIGSGVTSIEGCAFENCRFKEAYFFGDTQPTISISPFISTYIRTFYVKDTYKGDKFDRYNVTRMTIGYANIVNEVSLKVDLTYFNEDGFKTKLESGLNSLIFYKPFTVQINVTYENCDNKMIKEVVATADESNRVVITNSLIEEQCHSEEIPTTDEIPITDEKEEDIPTEYGAIAYCTDSTMDKICSNMANNWVEKRIGISLEKFPIITITDLLL